MSNFAGVAQSAEQLICNQQVAGSSPITSYGEVPERPKGADCKSVGEVLRRFDPFPLHHFNEQALVNRYREKAIHCGFLFTEVIGRGSSSVG
jgi:hypothetical protein